MKRGGARIGAGRKPLPCKCGRPKLKGKRTCGLCKPGKVLQHPSSPGQTVPTTNYPSPIEEFDAPDSLTMEARRVWLLQAPHAFRNRTLTRASALAFERYCQLVVEEKAEAGSSAKLGANHRGILRQINALELQFMLTPAGKPMVEPPAAPQQDADDAYFG